MKLPKELTTVTPLSKYLALFLLIALPFIGFYLGFTYKEKLDILKGSEEETNILTAAPTPTPLAIPTTDPSITANWKAYKDDRLSFEHPSKWNIFNKQEEGRYVISENPETADNVIYVSINDKDKVSIGGPITQGSQDERIIEGAKAYDMISTAGLGNYDPEQISRTIITLDGKKATQYIIRLNEPGHLLYSQVTWLFLIDDNQLIKIKLEGKDQKILDQILSTFQFTQ